MDKKESVEDQIRKMVADDVKVKVIAKRLGVSRTTVWRKMRELGLVKQ